MSYKALLWKVPVVLCGVCFVCGILLLCASLALGIFGWSSGTLLSMAMIGFGMAVIPAGLLLAFLICAAILDGVTGNSNSAADMQEAIPKNTQQ